MTDRPRHPDRDPASLGGPDRERLDRYFDRERDPASRAELVARIRDDARFASEFAQTQRVVSMLGSAPEAPDLSAGILAEIGEQRAFLRPRWRRVVTAGRVAVAACVALGIGLVAMAQQYGQEQGLVPEAPTPVSHLADVSETTVAETIDSLRSVKRSFRGAGARIELSTAERFEPMAGTGGRSVERGQQTVRVGFASGFTLPGSAGDGCRSVPTSAVWVAGAVQSGEGGGPRPAIGWATADFDRFLLAPVSGQGGPGLARSVWIRSVDPFTEPTDASDGLP
ncbi:MAG: hypothetical protein ACF8SC_03055 [Phycisphaerales bacterium JB037]